MGNAICVIGYQRFLLWQRVLAKQQTRLARAVPHLYFCVSTEKLKENQRGSDWSIVAPGGGGVNVDEVELRRWDWATWI